EEDEIFQTRFGNFLSIRQMSWLWKELQAGEVWPLEFDLPGYVPAGGADGTTTATLNVYWPDRSAPPGPVTLELAAGEEPVATLTFPKGVSSSTFAIPARLLQEGDNRFTVRRVAEEDAKIPGGVLYVDSLDFVYTSLLKSQEGAH